MTTNNQHTIIQSLLDVYPLMLEKNNDTVNDVGVIEPAFNKSVLVCVVSHTSSSTTSESKGPCLIHRAHDGRMCLCFGHNIFVSFIYLRLDQPPTILNCVVSNTSRSATSERSLLDP